MFGTAVTGVRGSHHEVLPGLMGPELTPWPCIIVIVLIMIRRNLVV